MDIGQFNKRITIIQENTVTTDEMGFEVTGVADYMTLWAYVNNLKGKEFWEAKQIGFENTLEIIVRYNPKLEDINTKTFFIKYKNKIFNIIHIDNIKFENKFIKIKVIERG